MEHCKTNVLDLEWDETDIDESIKKRPHMIHYIEQWACVSFLVWQKEALAKIVLTFEEIIMEKETKDLENNQMNGTDIPNRTMYDTPVHFSTPMDPISSICNEMKEIIKKLLDKIDYIKEYAPVDFLIDEKKKLAEIVITLEEIIDKRQKEKINNNM